MSNLKNNNLEFVLKKTIADFVTDEVKQDRNERMDELLAMFRELGVDRFTVELPDGQAVATLSIAKPKPKLAIKETELMGWLETNGYEHLIKTVTIPERTEKQLPVDVLDQIGAQKTEDGEYVTPWNSHRWGIYRYPRAIIIHSAVRQGWPVQDP